MNHMKRNDIPISPLCYKRFLSVYGYAGLADEGLGALRRHIDQPHIDHFNFLMRGLAFNTRDDRCALGVHQVARAARNSNLKLNRDSYTAILVALQRNKVIEGLNEVMTEISSLGISLPGAAINAMLQIVENHPDQAVWKSVGPICIRSLSELSDYSRSALSVGGAIQSLQAQGLNMAAQELLERMKGPR
mmetsp:Transcript_18116/g.37671  ORF Transcript_18116/g.37671 Transcript_18116/m.37671 type:complete len:190 (-) Transcript_18116:390-959(-)